MSASIALHDEFRSTAGGDPRDHARLESGLQVGPHVERHRAEAREYDNGPDRHREAQYREGGREARRSGDVRGGSACVRHPHSTRLARSSSPIWNSRRAVLALLRTSFVSLRHAPRPDDRPQYHADDLRVVRGRSDLDARS